MRHPRPLTPVAAALSACLLALLIAAPAGASAAKPIKGKPKIVDIEGFAYPTDVSLEHWRAGAVLVTRYPKVLPKAFPAQIRKLLSYRAVGKLKVFDHGKRIASRHDNGGLPVYVAGHSVYYAHLLVATQKQSDRIFQSLGLKRPIAKGRDPCDQWSCRTGPIATKAAAQVRVRAKGRTVARSGTKSAQSVNLVGAADPPYVVNGCAIQPETDCFGSDLTGANLAGANLAGATFTYAALDNANLSGANLSGARFVGASMTDANLSRANLTDANLRGADLNGADISGTRFCRTTMPDGTINNNFC